MMRRRSDTEFSFAPSGLADFPSATHGLRPFGRLRAGCGLHSYAASRLNTPSTQPSGNRPEGGEPTSYW